jgi:hypothetical protein
MTTETIHTCSYECERPDCIRAQRDELASRLAAAPPPAAARGDVRGLVADMRTMATLGIPLKPEQADRWADRIESALAAEGVQAGEVEFDRVLDANALAPAALRAFNAVLAPSLQVSDLLAYRLAMTEAIAAALSQQPEARGVVEMPGMVRKLERIGRLGEGEPVWIEPSEAIAILAALTGERNG